MIHDILSPQVQSYILSEKTQNHFCCSIVVGNNTPDGLFFPLYGWPIFTPLKTKRSLSTNARVFFAIKN